MPVAIAEPVTQTGNTLDSATIASVTSGGQAPDAFLAILANLLETPALSQVAQASRPPSRPVADGPPAIPLVEAPTAAFVIATRAASSPIAPAVVVDQPALTVALPTPSPIAAPAVPNPPQAPGIALPQVPAPLPAAPENTAPMPGSAEPQAPPAPQLPQSTKAAPAMPKPAKSAVGPSPDPQPVVSAALPPDALSVAPPPVALPPPPTPTPTITNTPESSRTVDAAPPLDRPAVAVDPAPAHEPPVPNGETQPYPIVAAGSGPATPDPAQGAVAQALLPAPAPPAPQHMPLPEPVSFHVATALSGAPPAPAVTGQIGAAFVVLGRAGDGSHQLTLTLQPPDLGALRISIEQAKDSPARIAVTAANPSTLLTLLRDQPALNKALDDAGISGDGRVLTFHLGAITEPAPVAAPIAAQNLGDAPQSGGQYLGLSGQSAQPQSGRGGQDHPTARPEPPPNTRFADNMPADPTSPIPSARPALTGIDITA